MRLVLAVLTGMAGSAAAPLVACEAVSFDMADDGKRAPFVMHRADAEGVRGALGPAALGLRAGSAEASRVIRDAFVQVSERGHDPEGAFAGIDVRRGAVGAQETWYLLQPGHATGAAVVFFLGAAGAIQAQMRLGSVREEVLAAALARVHHDPECGAAGRAFEGRFDAAAGRYVITPLAER